MWCQQPLFVLLFPCSRSAITFLARRLICHSNMDSRLRTTIIGLRRRSPHSAGSCFVPTEQERPSEISTDFVKVGEREQSESSAAAPSVWNSGSPTREGGREGENASTFCCVGLAHSRGKKMAGIEIEEVAVAGGGGSADIIGDREENISGGGERTWL